MKAIYKFILVLAVLLTAHESASAVSLATVIKLGLGGTGPDVNYTYSNAAGGSFFTVNDGDAGTLGDQNTNVEYVGILDPMLADIMTGASFSFSGITSAAGQGVSDPFTHNTTGGSFALYDAANNLLLQGLLSGGQLSAGFAGSYFDTSFSSFTGGSLLSYLANSPVAVALSLTGIQRVNLQDGFSMTSDATGLIAAAAVPEPATVTLLISGLVGGLVSRRKRVVGQ